jgi:hypothetical protein
MARFAEPPPQAQEQAVVGRSADGRDKPKPPRGVRRAPSPAKQYRAGVPWWRVYIFLGDQVTSWALCGDVQAFDEKTAITIAREHIAVVWPLFAEIATNGPAIARAQTRPTPHV